MINSNGVSRHLAAACSIAAAAMLALAGLSTVAMADQKTLETRSQQVSLADLDLSTAAGERVAHERLHQVARNLCSQVADNDDLSHQSNYTACIETAMAKATERLQAMANRSVTAPVARNHQK